MLPNGEMSGWLRRLAGAEVRIRGPFGECFYQEEEPTRPIVLAGTGTGLAPLVGDFEGRGGSSAPWGNRALSRELALRRALLTCRVGGAGREVTDSHVDGELTRSFTRRAWRSWALATERAPLDQLVISTHPKLHEHRVYLCGNPDIVRRLRKLAYLAGAPLDRIHSDAFAMPAPAPARARECVSIRANWGNRAADVVLRLCL